MDYSGCPDDASFGPSVHGCRRRDFDFTLKFESIFFSILPAAIFILLAVIRLVWLRREPVIAKGRVFQLAKLGLIAPYVALRFTSFILSIVWRGEQAALFISSATLEVIASALLLPVSFSEHARSRRPSFLLSVYLTLSLLFDIARARSFWLVAVTRSEDAFAGVFTASVALKAVIFLTESYPKTRWILWGTGSHSPEETTGFWGLAVFSWLWKLFILGRRKVLSLDDLFHLDHHMSSDVLRRKLQQAIDASSTRGQKNGLAKALAKSLAGPFLFPVVPRIALSAFKFGQPFLTNSLLSYLEIPASERPVNSGYGLIGAVFLVYSGIALSTSFYYYLRERSLWMMRGALASVVYEHTMRSKLSVTSDSAVLTLMSTDIERARLGCTFIHEFWASVLESGIALWLLYRELGAAFVAPVVVCFVCIAFISIVGRLSGPRQNIWMQKVQERVGALSHIVTNMKTFKIAGLTDAAESLLQRFRETEVGAGSSWRMTMIMAAIIGFAPSMISPFITFAVTGKALDATRIFTALSFIVLLTDPLSQLLQYVPPLLAAFSCVQRIQNFLERDPREDFRESLGSSDGADVDSSEKSETLIRITKGDFGWEEDKSILSNIALEIPARALTIVIGPIACGKSTLLKVLLGETPFHSGRVLIGPETRGIGYCDQTAFLTNETVRDNILGYVPFDQARYNEVLEATMLLPDLATFPQGDRTKIGSGGVTLSGGQKQRVSMARALYSNSNLFIFDDSLSGLDADTEEQVFRRVFAPGGLIRRRNATAILSTHSVRHLPSADHIIALSQEGVIAEQGTFHDLDALGGYVNSLKIHSANKSTDDVTLDSSNDPPSEENDENLTRSKTRKPPPPIWAAADERSRQTGDMAVYKHYAMSMKPITLISFLLACVALAVFYNFPQVWLNFWSVDLASSHRAHSQAYWIGIYALFLLLSLMFIGIICLLVFIFMTAQSGITLHHQTLRAVIGAPLRFFTNVDAGIVINLFSQDISLIDMELPQSLLNATVELFILIGMAVVVATASPYIAASYPFFAALMWLVQKLYLPTSRQLRLLDLETKAPLYTHFTDTVAGVATLRAFGWTQESLDFNLKLLDNSQRPAYLLAMVQHCLTFILSSVVTAVATLVVALTTQVKAVTGPGLTGASMVTLMSLGNFISHLIVMYTMVEISLGAVSRLKSFHDTVVPESTPEEDAELPLLWPWRGAVDIQDVSASYSVPDQPTESGNSGIDPADLVLKNINMSTTPGEKIAICGRSGSGKSSLFLLLLRLFDPLAGSADGITIDGIPLRRVKRSSLRERVIAVPQDSVFFPDGHSFKTNLDPSNLSTESDCKEVLGSVGLWQVVVDNGGLDSSLSTNMLSHGQRQLFGLARAILRRRIRSSAARSQTLDADEYPNSLFEKGGDIGGLLLLDEVGSSVDKDTERTMQALIREEFAEYTTIMISHRLDAVMDFDRVLVMDRGQIVESGRPRELVQQESSMFKNLWAVSGARS
ncbi:ABC transporter domain-containing protein [Trichoderma breve]|uniref:ABC transporter domain-containing protein n=1 Tax=Trichoderma breve TaxID=2034170 RepID=A0A9W9BBL8_9HYPO|nr:ABC transporter domain-containing protein [Trichoderma breve]KAJ4856963.1 ABC transporter domain-containing protein [Trichoderma breve]